MERRATRIAIAVVVALFGSAMSAGAAAASVSVRPPPPPGRSFLWDGSFERPVPADPSSAHFKAGTHLRSWRVNGPVFTTPAFPAFETPPSGLRVLNLRDDLTTRDGEICQTVSELIPAAEYRIRFFAASIIGESTIDVTFGGAPALHLDVPSTLPAEFHTYAAVVTATTTSADLCLHGHPVNVTGFPLVDAVRLKPV